MIESHAGEHGEVRDKEQLGLSDGDRSLIYDIFCETEDGDHIIVEMQNKYQPYFKKRSIYYVSRSIVEQGERGNQWKYDIKAVYLVAFLNFKLSDISKDFRTDVALMDMKHRTVFSDKVRLIYLQLPYFTKEADDCQDVFERIIYVLKHMDALKRMPWMLQDAVFKKLSEITDMASLNKEERQKYDESLRHYRDTLIVMEGQYLEGEAKGRAEGEAKGRAEGRVEGRAEGRAEGLAEGRAEEKRDTARKMKQKGLPADLIAEMTGLSLADIEEIG